MTTGNQRLIRFLMTFIIGAALGLAGCKDPATPPGQQPAAARPKDSATFAPPVTKFGIVTDSFNVIEKTIQRNEFLANILEVYHVEDSLITVLAEKSKP